MTKKVITGITTTGTPHLGNYVGAIRPAINLSKLPEHECYFFLADYHALVKNKNSKRLVESTLEVASTWLAAGADAENITLYRQSDVPEVTELAWLLTCITPKGLMNRSHAYKAACDKNIELHKDNDYGITMGLFSYPILMAADILLFNADLVPVGKDQIQHVEITRDIAQKFNKIYSDERGLIFNLPKPIVSDGAKLLIGTDGRKMSKSYHNTIPLFKGGSHALLKSINKIITNSKGIGEPKDVDETPLMMIFEAFSSKEDSIEFRNDLLSGISWSEAKNRVYEAIGKEISPMQEKYESLIHNPKLVKDILDIGSKKARDKIKPFLAQVREIIGIQ